MPSPFLKMPGGVKGRTRDDRPRAIDPVPERVAGDNQPYRGTETHGVAPTEKPHDPETYGVDPENPNDGIKVVMEEPKKEPDPIPVRLVQEFSKELRTFGTDRITVDFTTANNPANRAVEILGQDEQRKSLTLLNMEPTNIMLVGRTREEVLMRGYPLGPGKEMSLSAETPVFVVLVTPAFAFPNSVGVIAYKAEFVVEEK